MPRTTETPTGCLDTRYPWWARLLFTLIAGGLLAWSAYLAFLTVTPCQMPREWDVLRDISIAQSLEDGCYPEDPSLGGEISWYNPLTGGLLALIRSLNGQSLMRIAVVSGPVVNLLAPAGFYLITALLFGHAAALAGLCLFLFGKDGASPSYWTCAYSPWLLAPLYSMGLMFLTLAVYKHALEKKTVGWFMTAGLLLGISFLAHTAPAIVAGSTMLLITVTEIRHAGREENPPIRPRRLLFWFLLALLTAFFVSLPYTGPILWRYQFQVLNPWPSLYASQHVELQNLPGQIKNALSLRNGIALFGLVQLWPHRRKLAVKLVVCWGTVVFALLIQHYAWQALKLEDIILPAIMPGHHAAMHLAAWRTLLFGVGIVAIGTLLGRIFKSLTAFVSVSSCLHQALPGITAGILALASGICLYLNNPYSGRIDFQAPEGTAHYDLYERHVPLYEWIRDHTPPQAVFLCLDENLGIKTVMPAGRKLVNPMLLYFNPYVDRGPATLRQQSILKALDKADKTTLCNEAGIYPMLFLALDEPVDKEPPLSTELYRAGGSVIYEVHTCWKKL